MYATVIVTAKLARTVFSHHAFWYSTVP